MMWQLWVAFAMGVLARWGDRIQFVIAEAEGRTLGGFIKNNWGRLLIRGPLTCYLFYVLIDEGVVTNRVAAISVGISADVLIESFLDRAKRIGEGVMQKLGKGGTK